MGFSLGTFFYVIVLWLNAVCILSEDRFLSRVGWGSANTNGFNQPGGGYQSSDSFFNEPPSYGGMASSGSSGNQTAQVGSIKHKILTLVHAIRTLLRIPLIFLNIVIIVYELIAG